MQITLTRSGLKRWIDAIADGACLCNPGPIGTPWSDSDLLGLAGVCMAQLLERREELLADLADEPLRCDTELPYGKLSTRLRHALNFAIQMAGVARDEFFDPKHCTDKTYHVEVAYDRDWGRFELARIDDEEDSPEDEPGAAPNRITAGAPDAANPVGATA